MLFVDVVAVCVMMMIIGERKVKQKKKSCNSKQPRTTAPIL
jgi:hypothetical protein